MNKTSESNQNEWTVDQLSQALPDGGFFIFDVRNADEFESWRIEGPVLSTNIPYFEIMEKGERDDLVECVESCAKQNLFSKLPKDRTVLTVCAKGKTSAYVAAGLRKLGYDSVSLRGGMNEWGKHYEINSVTAEGDSCRIFQIVRSARGCLSYFVCSGEDALVIDPSRHIVQYTELAKQIGAQIRLVLDTHAHADHISGGPALAEATGAKYGFHPYDAIHPFDVLPAQLDYQPIWNDYEIKLGSVSIKALHMPGHTLGNLVYLIGDRFLFCGDTMFISSIARPDLGNRAESWARLHHASLEKLLELPESILVLPGHFASIEERNESGVFARTSGELKGSNADLQLVLKGQKIFVDSVLQKLTDFPEQYVQIKRVNAGLVEVDEEQATELELGKNHCAVSAGRRGV